MVEVSLYIRFKIYFMKFHNIAYKHKKSYFSCIINQVYYKKGDKII